MTNQSMTFNRDLIDLPDIVIAAYRGDGNAIVRLLSADGDVNAADHRNGMTLLHIACLQGNEEVVELLLAHRELNFGLSRGPDARKAWQLAGSVGFLSLSEKVHEAELERAMPNKPQVPGPA